MVMRGFANQEVSGTDYFNYPQRVSLPQFDSIERRGGVVIAGHAVEIDIIAEWTIPHYEQIGDDNLIDEEGTDAQGADGLRESARASRGVWLVEAKYTKEPITKSAVEHFLAQANKFTAQSTYSSVVFWFFAKAGFTQSAVDLMQEAGCLYSDWKSFHALAKFCGFLGLPRR